LLRPLGKLHGWVYLRTMAATVTWKLMGDLPAAAAGMTSAGMSYAICVDMALSTVIPHVSG
jgi:hypothetical protein